MEPDPLESVFGPIDLLERNLGSDDVTSAVSASSTGDRFARTAPDHSGAHAEIGHPIVADGTEPTRDRRTIEFPAASSENQSVFPTRIILTGWRRGHVDDHSSCRDFTRLELHPKGRDDHEVDFSTRTHARGTLVLMDFHLSRRTKGLRENHSTFELEESITLLGLTDLIRPSDECDTRGSEVTSKCARHDVADSAVGADDSDTKVSLESGITDSLQRKCCSSRVTMRCREFDLIGELGMTIEENLSVFGGDLGRCAPADGEVTSFETRHVDGLERNMLGPGVSPTVKGRGDEIFSVDRDDVELNTNHLSHLGPDREVQPLDEARATIRTDTTLLEWRLANLAETTVDQIARKVLGDERVSDEAYALVSARPIARTERACVILRHFVLLPPSGRKPCVERRLLLCLYFL